MIDGVDFEATKFILSDLWSTSFRTLRIPNQTHNDAATLISRLINLNENEQQL